MSTPFLPAKNGPTGARKRAEILFHEALDLPPGEREAFLHKECGSDASLRAEVDGYLHHYEQAGSFLEDDSSVSPELEAEFARLKPEEVGERIGPYKLLEQIGEGGFGTVWVAEQEKPIRRRVALKIIKLGMDTKEVIARFEQERQALAMMDHPNIAKVLEAGATGHGRPFFVMELVRGVKITDYCDQAKLPTEERLRLFIAVCQAVQHAHQKGIIHRDLKPSNILVTLHDGVPVAKVIDFGVAKATQQQRLTDLTVYTQFEQMIGTPLYMSPEQAEMSGLDVDTRSDIYSLGVLLYELLIGKTPFDPERLMKAGFDEMRRVIREEEPQKPSTLLSTMAAEARTNVARHRDSEGAKLISRIEGDLDWIVMKALEKDRNRRYETASGLARDIERHLTSEPVLARPPSNLYRFRRFAKRNKVVFAASAAVLSMLVVGLGVSTWMFFQEKRARERAVAAEQEQGRLRQLAVAAEKAQEEERQIAEGEARKAEREASKSGQVAQFLTDMLKGVGPSVALGRDTKLLREILDKTAERVSKDLKDQPEVEAELRSIIGEVYRELGAHEQARAMHTEALAIRKTKFGNEHPSVAASLYYLATVLFYQGELAEAETMHREALAMRRKLLGNEHPGVAESLNDLALALSNQGKLAEAETMHREALAMHRKLLGNEHPDVAKSLSNLAHLLYLQGKLAEAETMHREALAMHRKLLGNEHPDIAASLSGLAVVLHDQRKLGEAEAVYREALAMGRKLLGNEHPNVATYLGNLAFVLHEQGKLAEAETMSREGLAMERKLLGNEHPNVATSLNNLAIVLRKQDKLDEAETMQREALAMGRKLLGNEHPDVARSLGNLASVRRAQGKPAEAEIMYREALAMLRKLHGNEHPDVAKSLNYLANLLYEQALAMDRKLLGNVPPGVATSLNNLALLLHAHGKLAEAEIMYHEALAMRRKLHGNEHPEVTRSLIKLTDCLASQGRRAEAEAMLREELGLRKKELGNENPSVARILNGLSSVLVPQGRLAEAETMNREALAIDRKSAKSPKDLEGTLNDLADIVCGQGKYAEAEPLYRELVESREARLPSEDRDVVSAKAGLARLLADWAWSESGWISEAKNGSHADRNRLPEAARKRSAATGNKPEISERAREAERLLRECLATQLRSAKPNEWRTDENRSGLGSAVLAVAVTEPALTSEARQAKFAEAESLMLEGNNGVQQNKDADGEHKRHALTRIVRLYQTWNKPKQVADWQRKLADFDKAAADTENAGKTVSPKL